MQKYDGKVVHKAVDEVGEIEVVDDAVYRSMHFGTDPKQSSMLLRDPIYLALSYTRAMSSAVLFCDHPKKALLIGLGGGSLAKFLLHYFPDCRIDAVETRESVINVAQSHFQLPQEPRLNFHIDDGGRYVRNHTDTGEKYDLIFVDAFLGTGIARTVCGISFFDACRALLSDEGIFSMNLWNGDFITAREMFDDIRETFDGNALRLPIDGKDNTVALAANGGAMKKQLKKLRERAERLSALTGIEYTVFLKAMRKHNSWLPF